MKIVDWVVSNRWLSAIYIGLMCGIPAWLLWIPALWGIDQFSFGLWSTWKLSAVALIPASMQFLYGFIYGLSSHRTVSVNT